MSTRAAVAAWVLVGAGVCFNLAGLPELGLPCLVGVAVIGALAPIEPKP